MLDVESNRKELQKLVRFLKGLTHGKWVDDATRKVAQQLDKDNALTLASGRDYRGNKFTGLAASTLKKLPGNKGRQPLNNSTIFHLFLRKIGWSKYTLEQGNPAEGIIGLAHMDPQPRPRWGGQGLPERAWAGIRKGFDVKAARITQDEFMKFVRGRSNAI